MSYLFKGFSWSLNKQVSVHHNCGELLLPAFNNLPFDTIMVAFPRWPMPTVKFPSFLWDFLGLLSPNAVELLEESSLTILKPE